ncbi:G-type lectin S-receptor-like serine/threonine-protein kinase At2g19130 [Silene latifolia]|uniref:G-type lectin S-receptor-like serine/threonine-protein kinase At2g19130 n=1 Tax=Silene latifolia TaxID=37657 RepID=UPI003D77594D
MENLYGLCFKLYHLTLIISFIIPFSSGLDRITVNNSISGDETIISAEGNFELGFFQPGKSSNWYIGIWYKKVSVPTVVWVANRVNPVLDKHSYEFKLLDGNLVLTNMVIKSPPIWSTDLNLTNRKSVQAVLLDSGNLVLTDGPNTSISEPLWQSFENLTDTWLPGGKIEYNKKTNKSQHLSSWKNLDDPSPGLFTLEINHELKSYIIMWNETIQYWSSGSWNPKQQIFSLVPEMRLNFLYSFNFTDNENETYFSFNLYDPTIISRFVMDSSGVIKTMTWLENSQDWNQFWSEPKQQCQVYAYCGGFGSCTQNSLPFCSCLKGFEPVSNTDWGLSEYSGGCNRSTPLGCENSNSGKAKDRFFVYEGIKLPENAKTVAASSLQECELACLNNCSCNAYTYDNSDCSVWFGELLNFQQLSEGDPNGKILYLKLAASEFPSKSKTKLIVGIAAGFIALILVILGLLLARRRRQKAKYSESKTPVEGSLIAFGYKEIQNATKNFSEKLGGGGFGSVFKGTLPDSSVIAVKKLESFSQGEKQFRTEVSTIGTVQHVNLVRLRGFCSEGTKKLLVYDHMENGSLDYHLFPDKNNTTLDWPQRYQIALGTARGLAYLHEKCRDCIIHCDIKPENILLDAEFCPRVADFGLAKLVGRDFSRVLTTMRGTRGYLAPEWLSGVAITAKADVFSYGMVLFELLSGNRNIQQSGDGTIKFFPTWATSKITQDGDIMTILDSRLENNADATEVMKICKLACWCIQDDEYNRPSMGQVVQILEGVLDVNMPPIPKSLQVFNENDEEQVLFFTESSSGQSSQTRNTSSLASSSS